MSERERERRLAQNEALFRDVNERVADVHADWNRIGAPVPLRVVCECARPECAEMIGVTTQAYERVRNHGARFLIVPGHEIPSVEEVVENGDGFSVIEKTGASRAYAEQLDPRS